MLICKVRLSCAEVSIISTGAGSITVKATSHLFIESLNLTERQYASLTLDSSLDRIFPYQFTFYQILNCKFSVDALMQGIVSLDPPLVKF